MNQDDIIKRVAAGIRRMKIKPIAFIFLQFYDDEYTWDQEKILEYPVYHCSPRVTNNYIDSMVYSCPFVPLFNREMIACAYDSINFWKGWEEYDI